MRLDEIRSIIKNGESEVLELKKSTGQLTRATESLCAFLNGLGGMVIIGVTPEGKIVGQHITDKTLQDIANTLRNIEPTTHITMNRVALDQSELEILVLEAIPVTEARPYIFDGRPYYRTGTTTAVMPQDMYQQLLLNRAHSKNRWENSAATEFELTDLDREEILKTVRTGIAAGRLPESTGTDPVDVLDRLGLRTKGIILNAAVVLFGKVFLPYYTQCQIRLARFKGTNKTEFLDNKQLYGHAFSLLDEAMFFIQRHLPVAGKITPGVIERIDEPIFPPLALREALVNAFCHRDYANPGGAISVAIFDDRLEIWSEGILPFGLKVEDLKRDHPSRPRNPLIADVFFRRGLVERWGRGTQTIVELCVKAGHPEPEFIEQAGSVGVRFFPRAYVAPHRVGHDLTIRQREILQIVAEMPLSLREIIAKMSAPPSEAMVRNELYHLKKLGLVVLHGYGRGSRWFLVREEQANKELIKS